MSFQGQTDLTGQTLSGKSIVTVVSSSPKRYQIACTCGSSWTETHERLQAYINGQVFYPCKNESHRRGLPTNDPAYEQYKRERKQELAAAEIQREIELRRRYGTPTIAMETATATEGKSRW